MIAILDLGISNIGSLQFAFDRVGLRGRLTRSPTDIRMASAIILPGVGAFQDAMSCLRANGLVEELRRAVDNGKPLFGICLGMQLLATESDEHGHHEGLGLIPGSVNVLPESPDLRVPNIGWCNVARERSGVLFPNDCEPGSFYFVHSYHFVPTDKQAIVATISAGETKFAAAVEAKHVIGVQFHPEKSQDAGLALLSRYVNHLKHIGCYES